MTQYVDKSAVVAEIENLLDKGKYHEEYDCAYRDGNNGALYALKGKLDTLKVKEMDLEKEIDKWWWGKTWQTYGMMLNQQNIMDFAKHFFELGIRFNNPITATDRCTAEEIIINLKRIESDYRIDLTKEIEWLRNQVKK